MNGTGASILQGAIREEGGCEKHLGEGNGGRGFQVCQVLRRG